MIADEARSADSWERASFLIAKVHNVNCSKRSDMVRPEDVNLHLLRKKHAEREHTPVEQGTAMDLARMFRGWL